MNAQEAEEICQNWFRGRKIDAIKSLRYADAILGLRGAKEYLERNCGTRKGLFTKLLADYVEDKRQRLTRLECEYHILGKVIEDLKVEIEFDKE